jgi:hypothetical protein
VRVVGATAALPECIVFGGMAMGYDDPSSFANKTEAVRQYMMQMVGCRADAHAAVSVMPELSHSL